MSPSGESPASDPPQLSRGQWLLLFVLAAVQFMHTVDFVIVMPLAGQLKSGLGVGNRQFGHVVSAYGLAAFLAGLLVAPWLDRFDRKRSLLVLFAGFTLGTLLCALAPDYAWLLAGRALAGGFGGIAAANVLAIVGDAFPDRRRGLATGVVMSAFSVSSIVGVPAGIVLAKAATWRMPFFALAAGSAVVWLIATFAVPPLRSHLAHLDSTLAKKPGIWQVIRRPAHLKAFGLMLTLVFGGFLMIPFLADFLVKNVGISENDPVLKLGVLRVGGLELMYVISGISTLVTMNVIGRLADRFPRLLLFRILGLLAMVPVYLITVLPHGTPLPLILLVAAAMMILLSGRMVPLTAVITGIAPPQQRGTFMSLLASLQQFGMAAGSFVAGFLMTDTASNEPLVGYGNAGLASVIVGALCVALVGVLKPARQKDAPAPQRLPSELLTPSLAAAPSPGSSPAAAGIAPAPGGRGRG
jgi:DHA1 family inner membrane transport protein